MVNESHSCYNESTNGPPRMSGVVGNKVVVGIPDFDFDILFLNSFNLHSWYIYEDVTLVDPIVKSYEHTNIYWKTETKYAIGYAQKT